MKIQARKTDALYRWLPALIFAYVALCFALHPFSPFFTRHLADPDDYMRLNEVIAWLNGQSWYDLSVPRLSPGTHTVIHWSRLIDMPIALVALPFMPSFGVTGALLAAAMIVPLIWFALLLALVPALAAPGVGAPRANLACVFVLFMPLLLFNYTPGRVDHHGAQALIAGFGLLALMRIIADDKAKLFAILAALFFACGFWIGAEILPWAILFIGCLGFIAAAQGGSVARHAALFGLCLPVFTAALIPIALPASEFSSRALSWFSPAYILFAALAGGVLIALYGISLLTQNKYLRLPFFLALTCAAATVFFTLIPSAMQGPFTDYDTFDATTALDNISEAQPLSATFHINRFMPATWVGPCLTFTRLLTLPLLALIVCLWQARRDVLRRPVWLVQSLFLSVALALTCFWQMRVGLFMELFAIAPLTYLLCRWWEKLKWGLWNRSLFWAEIGAFVTLTALPVVILPALIDATPFYPDIILFPAARGAAVCPLESVTPFLNDNAGLGAKRLTILNSSDTGPQILFATRHNAVSGNFDVAGNADTYAFFHATDDAAAQAAARRTHADIVLLCRHAPMLYLGKDYYAASHIALRPDTDGMLRLMNTDARQPLIERLIRGDSPAWLKAIEIPAQTDYLLFRIKIPVEQK